jgi:hypothetical protein
MQNSNIDKIKAWIGLSRPPFHTVGILPFMLGTFLAYKINSTISIEVFILGVSGVILIMLSTYHTVYTKTGLPAARACFQRGEYHRWSPFGQALSH